MKKKTFQDKDCDGKITMKELISGMENLPEFQGMGDNIQTILEKFVKIDQNLFMEIIEKRSSSSHLFTIPASMNLRILKNLCFVLFKVDVFY